MEKHPIENIMSSTLENLQSMIDVNTVVGSPIFSDSGAVIIPVSPSRLWLCRRRRRIWRGRKNSRSQRAGWGPLSLCRRRWRGYLCQADRISCPIG